MPVRPLGQRGRVHVVLDRERGAERLAQPGERLRPVPAGQPAGQRHQVPLRVVDARAADDGLGDAVARDPGARAQLVGERRRVPRPGRPRVAARTGTEDLGPDLAREVGDARRAGSAGRCRGRARSPRPAGPRTAAPSGRAPPSAGPASAHQRRPAPGWPAPATRSAWTARRRGRGRHASTGPESRMWSSSSCSLSALISGGRAACPLGSGPPGGSPMAAVRQRAPLPPPASRCQRHALGRLSIVRILS